ncbi:hypothetical protein [Embleya scabrispora]|uniref:hypothetical protein n=1 Tax=Embleya scabrispora TaxID=159449 RepID=UPI000371F134|nr:hypothetical protein [Embleya scabrispora]MYS80771.1 hypothetical protein [Streptomyces sp. SID5474]
MTGSEAEAIEPAVDEGVRQIPATVVRVEQPASVTDARDRLLAAIGRAAERAGDADPGGAPEALEKLARAFVLVSTGSTAGGFFDVRNSNASVHASLEGIPK